MRAVAATLFNLVLTLPACAGVVDEGTVTAIDGKGGFTIATKKNGVLELQAKTSVLQDDPSRRPGGSPHSYKELRVGDYIEVHFAKAKKTCLGIRIIKRGAPACPPPDPDK